MKTVDLEALRQSVLDINQLLRAQSYLMRKLEPRPETMDYFDKAFAVTSAIDARLKDSK
jgi:hypothetical protein